MRSNDPALPRLGTDFMPLRSEFGCGSAALRFSGSPTQLKKEARQRRVRCKARVGLCLEESSSIAISFSYYPAIIVNLNNMFHATLFLIASCTE